MTKPPVEDQARALMSAWTEQRSPSSAVEARTWAAVSARAQAGELGPELGPDPLAAGAAGAGRLRLLVYGLGGTTLVAITVALALGWPDAAAPVSTSTSEALERPDEPTAAPPPAPEGDAPNEPAASLASEPAAAAAPVVSESPTSEADKRRRRRTPSEPAANATEDDLAAELELLGRARTSLKAGDPKAALAALDEHARRFPAGALRSERELTRITAACAAGDLDHAEQVARRFIRAHPSSTEAKRLADTCIGDRL